MIKLLKTNASDFKKVIIKTKPPKFDMFYIIIVIALSIFGTVMVFSAGTAYAATRYEDAYYFIKRQSLWLVIALCCMIITSKIHPDFYKGITPLSYLVTLFLLILVLIIGLVGNGAKRWISLGPLTIQPSEIAKITLIMILSKYFSDYEEYALEKKKKSIILKYGTLFPILLMLIPIILVMLQKHLSCIIILGTIGLLMIVASGANTKYISFCCFLGIIAVAALAIFTDYTKERITVWQNPEAYKLTGGWQTLQGLMAIGSGGILGVGLGNSVMKHCYVSEPANDMIYAILCEELGFIGAISVLILFGFLVVRGYKIALRAPDVYTRLLAFGITTKTAIQVMLNVSVVTNTIPNTGISLPFFSYGGSSLIMIFIEMGMMLSISRYSAISK